MENEKRLIDANALMKAIQSDKVAWRFGVPNTLGLLFDKLRIIIKLQPTVDAVEVVHGRWVEGGLFSDIAKCSVCGSKHFTMDFVRSNKFNYCPNCGAKMDGDGNG